MTQSSKFVANSVEQILLGLARGLRDAQAVLDDLPPTDDYKQQLQKIKNSGFLFRAQY